MADIPAGMMDSALAKAKTDDQEGKLKNCAAGTRP
jgi:hypothetical protein